MTRDELINLHQSYTSQARNVMRAKNHDYANDSDPFRNFRMFGRYGILVRMSDKLARLRSFLENGKFEVLDEGMLDTCLDLINYAILFAAYEEEYTSSQSNRIDGAKEQDASSLSERPTVQARQEPSMGSKMAGRCQAFVWGDEENVSFHGLGDATGDPYEEAGPERAG